MIDVRIEQVSEAVGAATMHGWHSSRLLKYDGCLYFSANKIHPEGDDSGDWRNDRGLIFKREADGTWNEVADIDPRVYTTCVDSMGRYWAMSPVSFSYCTMWRSLPNMDLKTLHRMYDGTCAYLGASVSPEDNYLLLHAEDTNHTSRFANAVMAVFYDRETDSWFPSKMVTPEGRFGYMGIIIRGRKVMALMQSTIFDPIAAPEEPHYNWRHLRIARTDDATKGEWRQDILVSKPFGFTMPSDLMVAPDGEIYLAYNHRGGDDSYEATEARPLEFQIARIGMDEGSEIFTPGVDIEGGGRLFVDSKGQWYVVGRQQDETLKLWRLDHTNGFKPIKQWDLPNTEKLTSMLHTLRPERFGGQANTDTIHMVSSDVKAPAFNTTVRQFGMWHASFKLPVNE